ncbi:MAG: hypothetical protein EOM21_21575, partial [Gammaproteobacteria bacterium]|nr:hypothetical protein [Gammaproteobacteria bacterium]
MAALKRLGWARNLMAARALLGDPVAGEAFKAKKVVEGYRARLLGTRAGGLSDIDYFTPLATLDDLSDYLDTLEGVSEAERAMGLIHVQFLNNAIRRNSVPTSGLPEAQAELVAKMNAMDLSQEQRQQAIYREIDARGSVAVKAMADRVADAGARQEARLAEINRLVDEGNAQDKSARAPYDAAVKVLRDAEQRMLANPNDADALRAWKEAQAARDATWDAY